MPSCGGLELNCVGKKELGRTVGLVADLPQPGRNLVVLIFSHVDVDDGDGQKRRQRDENHVDTEICT